MPTTPGDYAAVEAARNKVSALTRDAGDTEAAAATFRDDVMGRVREARGARGITNLQQDFGRATERLAVGRSQIVDRNQGVLNPLAINQITDQERGQNLGTLAQISQYEDQNSGTIDSAVQAGANTMQAKATRIKAQADAAATELQSLMEVVKQKQMEAQTELENTFREKQFSESVRQADRDFFNRPGPSAKEPKEPNDLKEVDLGDKIIFVDPKTGKTVGDPIPKGANPSSESAMINAVAGVAKKQGFDFNPDTGLFEKPKSGFWGHLGQKDTLTAQQIQENFKSTGGKADPLGIR